MSNRHNSRLLLAAEPEPQRPRPIEHLHPVLLGVVDRMEVLPFGDRASITETQLAHAVSLAISMLPDDEQSYIVSRIMTDDEIAGERLQSPEVQDLRRRVRLSGHEIRFLLRGSPAPDDDGEDDEVEDGCIVCFAQSDISVPCGCHYCRRCLRENIRTGLRSEVDFPPSCCRPFDEATIRLAGSPALVHLFRQLSAEYAVPSGERLYCHDPGCSSFIPPRAIQPAARDEDDATPVGTCPSCRKATCATCGGRSHRGLPCREEEDEEALWDMMDDQGLVGCPECGIVIALREGCNHMTCVCSAQFCYLCGIEWRRCSCPLYNSFHLRVPVRQRPGRRPVRRGGRAHLVGGAEGMALIPQLRYDPDDEIALAAVDFAPLALPAPAAAPDPAPNLVRELVVRRNADDHMEMPLHRDAPIPLHRDVPRPLHRDVPRPLHRDAPRPLQHRHHPPAVRPNLFNGGPVDFPPFPPFPPFFEERFPHFPPFFDERFPHFPPFFDEHFPPFFNEFPLPMPGAFPDDLPPPFLPRFPPNRQIVHHNPVPNYRPNHAFNNRPREVLRRPAEIPEQLEQAMRQLRITEATRQGQRDANMRRGAVRVEDIAREAHQALAEFERQREPRLLEDRRGRREPERRVREHGRRRRDWGR